MKVPKDIDKFDSALIAAAQLINFAMEYVLFSKGKVQWTVTLRHWNDDWLDKSKKDESKSPVRCIRGTFSNKPYKPEAKP